MPTEPSPTPATRSTRPRVAARPRSASTIRGSTRAAAPMTAVRVFNAAGTKVEDTSLPGAQDPNVTITITNGVARVAGLAAGFRIAWDTSTVHDQVLIQGVVGKFDIGGFGVDHAVS